MDPEGGREGLLGQVGGRRPVVFDVGANHGEYAKLALAIFGDRADIHCFEPSKAAYDVLQKKVGTPGSVSFWNFGLSDAAGNASLFSDAEGSPDPRQRRMPAGDPRRVLRRP